MSTFALEIWHKGSRCTIYSVRQDVEDEDSNTETDYFFDKFGQSEDEEILDAAQILLQFITKEISEMHGARIEFFNRIESKAQALPYKPNRENMKLIEISQFYPNFPLRLYCYRVSDRILILYNGGIKTANTAQEGKGTSLKFQDAQNYTKKIEEALRDKLISIKGSELFTDDEEIIL